MRVLLAGTAVLAVIAAVAGLMKGIDAIRQADDRPSGEKPVTQEAWLWIGTVEADPQGSADWLAVTSYDRKKKSGLMLYIPRTTYVEIPGIGLETIGKSMSLGKETMTLAAASNLMGIRFDHFVTVSDQSIRAIVDGVGGIQIHVDTKLTRDLGNGKVEVVFAEGDQVLDGKRAAEYMRFISPNGEETSRAVRHTLVWEQIFKKLNANSQAQKKLFSEGGPLVSDAKPTEVRAIFKNIASLTSPDLVYVTMPVNQTGVDTGQQLYAPDRERLEELVAKHLSAVRPAGAGKPGRRIEILNGNGRPGIGQEVSADLVPQGFRVVLNQNANSFDYEKTQIVVYSDSKAALETAREIKQLLGVGEIIVSRLSQSIVDVTVVVGKDYLDRPKE